MCPNLECLVVFHLGLSRCVPPWTVSLCPTLDCLVVSQLGMSRCVPLWTVSLCPTLDCLVVSHLGLSRCVPTWTVSLCPNLDCLVVSQLGLSRCVPTWTVSLCPNLDCLVVSQLGLSRCVPTWTVSLSLTSYISKYGDVVTKPPRSHKFGRQNQSGGGYDDEDDDEGGYSYNGYYGGVDAGGDKGNVENTVGYGSIGNRGARGFSAVCTYSQFCEMKLSSELSVRFPIHELEQRVVGMSLSLLFVALYFGWSDALTMCGCLMYLVTQLHSALKSRISARVQHSIVLDFVLYSSFVV
uniref:Uncharacterized protein n=1 Tax=Timema genevievae TaxID=629358 RepID=A0A7R9K2I6_TIMGE|nr:unnamed protein product [Timema genevievae]